MQRKRSDPNRPNWQQQLDILRADIEAMSSGPARDAAKERADRLKNAVHMERYLASTELRPPS